MPPHLIVFDMEFTSWPGSVDRLWQGENEFPEIVQIGAVKAIGGLEGSESASFSCYVRPVRHPILSPHFIKLTGITQARIEAEGVPFPEAYADFMDFAGTSETVLCCNGLDLEFLRLNCAQHGLAFPLPGRQIRETELTAFFSSLFPQANGKPPQSWRLPELAGLTGRNLQAHDALDDSRAILATLRHLAAKGVTPFA